jgi:predicted aldo/keto reductase-like oxidoreductase
MEYRQLPHGREQISVLGLGLGGIQKATDEEIEQVIRRAVANGINFFDLCAGAANVYAPVGRAIGKMREKVRFQLHFGAVYNESGEYGLTRDLETVMRTFAWELKTLGTDYADFGFLHCIDQEAVYRALMENGILEYAKELKDRGAIRHIGFSSHTPSVANRILDSGVIDMMMFSINPAYDFEKDGDEESGTLSERALLFRRCQAEGVGISVMKPFHAGKLLDAETSPFRTAMTREQCIQYALDRPGVLTVVPGVRGLDDLEQLLRYPASASENRDYSFIGGLNAENVRGTCVYCNHCQPCSAGIDVGLVNKYYDLALAGDPLAKNHYKKLITNAEACLRCGRCDEHCPFGVRQSERMTEIAAYFGRV